MNGPDYGGWVVPPFIRWVGRHSPMLCFIWALLTSAFMGFCIWCEKFK